MILSLLTERFKLWMEEKRGVDTYPNNPTWQPVSRLLLNLQHLIMKIALIMNYDGYHGREYMSALLRAKIIFDVIFIKNKNTI